MPMANGHFNGTPIINILNLSCAHCACKALIKYIIFQFVKRRQRKERNYEKRPALEICGHVIYDQNCIQCTCFGYRLMTLSSNVPKHTNVNHIFFLYRKLTKAVKVTYTQEVIACLLVLFFAFFCAYSFVSRKIHF